MKDESFLFILEDGPYPESYEVNANKLTWPLPEIVYAEDYLTGAYVKYWESGGEAKPEVSARGAKYKWDKDYTDHRLQELAE